MLILLPVAEEMEHDKCSPYDGACADRDRLIAAKPGSDAVLGNEVFKMGTGGLPKWGDHTLWPC